MGVFSELDCAMADLKKVAKMLPKGKRKSCKHLNCVIVEHGDWTTSHEFQNGTIAEHNNEAGSYSSRVYVHCYDCGMKRYFSLYSASTPKWLTALWEQMDES